MDLWSLANYQGNLYEINAMKLSCLHSRFLHVIVCLWEVDVYFVIGTFELVYPDFRDLCYVIFDSLFGT